MKKNVIAIFDIGKTNKKAFLFDENYQIVWEKSAALAETQDEDGELCEDIDLLNAWLKQTWAEIQHLAEFDIKALNFSTYGATFVHLDKDGNALTPIYNYLKAYPEPLKKQFYDTYGGEATFATQTASPVLGSLNAAMMIYRLKYEKPVLFDKIKYSLHLPQYLSFLFSGKFYSDITSIGCHTNLWDFEKKQYHHWLEKEGIKSKLAPINSKLVAKNGKKIKIGVGLHDSSAALIPYLMNFEEPFILLSTGTWSISLNPFNDSPLTFEELQADCLCYLTFKGQAVKASRLFAGYGHEQEIKYLAEKWKVELDFYKKVTFNPAFLEKRTESYESDYHQFIQKIVQQQVLSTNLVLKNSPVKRIFVDGGFSKNELYMRLLARAYPEMEVFAAEVAQATALGAALALHAHWNPQPLPHHLIELRSY